MIDKQYQEILNKKNQENANKKKELELIRTVK
jgi:hypothetical protein